MMDSSHQRHILKQFIRRIDTELGKKYVMDKDSRTSFASELDYVEPYGSPLTQEDIDIVNAAMAELGFPPLKALLEFLTYGTYSSPITPLDAIPPYGSPSPSDSPKPLQAPVTPITRVFARPQRSNTVDSSASVSYSDPRGLIMRGNRNISLTQEGTGGLPGYLQ
ncbi:hypothetical protein C8J57DRAFT_1706599 [Mycena rebaudengoi]|nr:hypothetical protein C8J57DRAFT_1706599 [Mycena rebaudengoi]